MHSNLFQMLVSKIFSTASFTLFVPLYLLEDDKRLLPVDLADACVCNQVADPPEIHC